VEKAAFQKSLQECETSAFYFSSPLMHLNSSWVPRNLLTL